ncbi:MAG TPA: hypothetical protein VEI73_12285 [Candidatus Acidoferrum sp.]|nr:hypothetical protein [Candidatus Acidoferrum sp.]
MPAGHRNGLPGVKWVQSDKLMRTYYPLTLLVLSATILPAHAQKESKNVQQKPTETSVCEIMKNPSAFNNKLVRVRGHVEVSFEYSVLEDDGCSDALWFALADGSGPPGLVIIVNGTGRPGAKNSKGATAKPIPVQLIRDATLRNFSTT